MPGRAGPICCRRCRGTRQRARRPLPAAAARTGPQRGTSAGTPHRNPQPGGRTPPGPRPASRPRSPVFPVSPGQQHACRSTRRPDHNPALGTSVARQGRRVRHELKAQRADEEVDGGVILLNHDGHQAQMHRASIGSQAAAPRGGRRPVSPCPRVPVSPCPRVRQFPGRRSGDCPARGSVRFDDHGPSDRCHGRAGGRAGTGAGRRACARRWLPARRRRSAAPLPRWARRRSRCRC